MCIQTSVESSIPKPVPSNRIRIPPDILPRAPVHGIVMCGNKSPTRVTAEVGPMRELAAAGNTVTGIPEEKIVERPDTAVSHIHNEYLDQDEPTTLDESTDPCEWEIVTLGPAERTVRREEAYLVCSLLSASTLALISSYESADEYINCGTNQ